MFTACGGARVVPLLATAGIPVTRTPSPQVPLEVVTKSTAVRDPLPVGGTRVAYGDVESALGHAVSSAAAPWASSRRAQRPEGWQLVVEIVDAEAEHSGGRLVVTLGVRATLRARAGNLHLAQGETACRNAGLVAPEHGAEVMYGCMQRIGRDLAGWLAAVEPDASRARVPDVAAAAGAAPIGAFGAGPGPDGDGDGVPDATDASDAADPGGDGD